MSLKNYILEAKRRFLGHPTSLLWWRRMVLVNDLPMNVQLQEWNPILASNMSWTCDFFVVRSTSCAKCQPTSWFVASSIYHRIQCLMFNLRSILLALWIMKERRALGNSAINVYKIKFSRSFSYMCRDEGSTTYCSRIVFFIAVIFNYFTFHLVIALFLILFNWLYNIE